MSFAERFEDLRIWQEAREQVFAIYPRNACECWKVDKCKRLSVRLRQLCTFPRSHVKTFSLRARRILGAEDVSFEVKQGKIVGIISRNRAGKWKLERLECREDEGHHG